MQNLQLSQDIVSRFHEALERLVSDKKIRGKSTFAVKHGIDRRIIHISSKNFRSGAFEIAWLTYLYQDFNVSPEWLLTGKGSFYLRPKPKPLPKLNHPDIIP